MWNPPGLAPANFAGIYRKAPKIHPLTRDVAYACRTSIVCFIMALALGSEDSPSLSRPFQLPLPSSKALWGARTRYDWEREYSVFLEQSSRREDRLETVGDVAVAQMQRDGGDGWGLQGGLQMVGTDALDYWLAGADELGTLLAAVIADV